MQMEMIDFAFIYHAIHWFIAYYDIDIDANTDTFII